MKILASGCRSGTGTEPDLGMEDWNLNPPILELPDRRNSSNGLPSVEARVEAVCRYASTTDSGTDVCTDGTPTTYSPGVSEPTRKNPRSSVVSVASATSICLPAISVRL